MPKFLRAVAEQNLLALQEERGRASRVLDGEASAFMGSTCTPRAARRFNLVFNLLRFQIESSTELFHKRLTRKLHIMGMIQRTMGKAEEDEDVRQLLITITDCRLVEAIIGIFERGTQAIRKLNGKDGQTVYHAAAAGSCSPESVAIVPSFCLHDKTSVDENNAAAGFPMKGRHEQRNIRFPESRPHVFSLGARETSAKEESSVRTRGNLSPHVMRAKASHYQSVSLKSGLRVGAVRSAGVSYAQSLPENRAKNATASAEADRGLDISRDSGRWGVEAASRDVWLRPTAGPTTHGGRIDRCTSSIKRSACLRREMRNGEERSIRDDVSAGGILPVEQAKRAKTSGEGFGVLKLRSRSDVLTQTALDE